MHAKASSIRTWFTWITRRTRNARYCAILRERVILTTMSCDSVESVEPRYIGSVVFLRKFNDFAGRRGHIPKWCTVRSYESAANALICAKGAMPVSRGLPLIVVYALYYAILLYGRWVFDVLTESGGCVCGFAYTETYWRIYISRA